MSEAREETPVATAQSPEPATPAPASEPAPATTTPATTTPENTALLPPQAWDELEDDASSIYSDADSALEDGEHSTASITSSILKGTNDEQQNEASDINHHVQTLGLDGQLFLAPLDKSKVQKVVDIGTGTGIWAIDFADEFPGASVIGTDISPIQPSWVPPNLQFQIDDCTKEWTFAENSLDYVHIRFLSGCIPDWTALFKQAYKCLKPGGIIETMEPSAYMQSDDDTIEENSAMGQWGKIFVEGGKKMGNTFTVFQDNVQNKSLEEAGFVDLHEHKYKSPIGSWPKDPKLREIGQYAQLSMESDFEGLIIFMTNVLGGWTREQILVYVSHLRREIRSGKKHGWYWQKIVWARKPEEE